jgi:trigger factor
VATSNINVSVEAPGGLERRLTVEVPVVEIEREIAARLVKVGKTAKIKGFRPGKVPQKVVRQRFGGQIREEVLSDVIRASFSRAIQQENLNPAGGPRIEPLSRQGDEHFSYRAIFDVFPEIELKGVESLAIERPHVEIDESDIDDMIEKLRLQRAEWQAAERKAVDGDRVMIDFEGRIGDEAFEGGSGRNVPVIVGAGQVIADFDKALKGVSAGENKTIKVRFPKDYRAESLAGQKAQFEITVHSVEEQVLPELDDEFIESFGVRDGGVEALRKDVRGNMQRELDERVRVDTKTRVLDALLAANPIEVPRALVAEEVRKLQSDAMQRLGIDDPEKAPAAAQFEPAARRRAALGLLVQELIREHGIELDPKRVDRRLTELCAPFEEPEAVERIYRGSRELMMQVEAAVLEDQVVDFLLEQGKTRDRKLAFREFMGV